MRVVVYNNKLQGNLDIIASKSYAHRAIIAASLANGKSVIKNVYLSNDIMATIEACIAFGADINVNGNELTIIGSEVKRVNKVVDAKESGSTLRFMIPIMLTTSEEVTFIGSANLPKRPLDEYFKIFDEKHIAYKHDVDYLPLNIKGALKPGSYAIKGNISSQYITGLLFALPLLNGDSKISLTTELESKSYVDLTLDILHKFGIQVENHNYQEFIIKGNQEYKPFNYIVEGDYSQAAFYLTSNAFGNRVNVSMLNPNSLQGDKKIIDCLKQFGLNLEYKNNQYVFGSVKLHGAEIDLADTPDLGPILFTLASTIEEESHFINTRRLKLKESDRILAMQEELEKIGAKFRVYENEVYIKGVTSICGDYEFDSHNDHRIAMSLAVLATNIDGSATINNAEAINKTYQSFFEDFKKLGGVINE